jgi:hypothetical protein
MKKNLIILVLLLLSSTLSAQKFETRKYGNNVLVGKVILKDLMHPKSLTLIKNAMVLKLDKKVKFLASDEDEANAITDEIRIYGDVSKGIDVNVVYKNLINRRVKVTAFINYAPSANYPLEVNIIRDFKYEFVTN